jgi:iron-sulfur cluster assembly accessory protein
VLIDPKSLPYLDGTELDYAREGLNEGFKFNNPNVKDACGCGESFKNGARRWPRRARPVTTTSWKS